MNYNLALKKDKIKVNSFGINNLSKKKYIYTIINLKKNIQIKLNKPNLGSIIILEPKKNTIIEINNKFYNCNKYRFFEFEKKNLFIQSNKNTLIGIAGLSKKKIRNKIKKFQEKELYKVNKPWGYEVWINGQKPTYSLKKIFIKKGFKTSLQFHKKKIETNYLHKGRALIHYSKFTGKNKPNKILNNIKIKQFKEKEYLNVPNYAIHRLEAKTNILLYEVSTPHLDDVMRISDDTNRKSGRIKTEHLK